MKDQYNYIDLLDTLLKIKIQAIEGIDFMYNKLPNFIQTPEQLFFYLQSITSYENDPPNTELLQTPKTLFLNNWHGRPGAGDCDCFTILAIASFLALGYNLKNLSIILAGRKKRHAVHIYLKVNNKNFDLTNPFFNVVKKYPFTQEIKLVDLWKI